MALKRQEGDLTPGPFPGWEGENSQIPSQRGKGFRVRSLKFRSFLFILRQRLKEAL